MAAGAASAVTGGLRGGHRPLHLGHGEERREHPQHLRCEERPGEHLAGLALGHDLAGAEHDDPGGDAGGQLDVVGGGARRRPARRMFDHRGLERQAGGGVDPSGGLVEEQHRGVAHRDGGDGHALALAHREAARVAVGELGEAEPTEPALDRLGIAPPEQGEGALDLGSHGGPEQQRVGLLGHERDRHLGGDGTGGRRVGASEQPEERGLPGAVAAEDGHDLALRHLEVDGRQHRAGAVGHRRAGGADEVVRPGQPGSSLLPGRWRGAWHRRTPGPGPGVADGEGQRRPAEQAGQMGDRRRPGERRQHLGRVAVVDDPPVVDHQHPTGHRAGPLEAVLGQEDRGAEVVVQPAHGGHHVVRALGVEHRGRLVEHEHRRPAGERASEGAPLALAP
ncbi:MAG: hypothetical protein R2711_01345 [Acidimicrobiales bacterium]